MSLWALTISFWDQHSQRAVGSSSSALLLPWLFPHPWFLSCCWGWILTLPGAAPFLLGSTPGTGRERDQETRVEPQEGAWDWCGISAETPQPGRSWKPPGCPGGIWEAEVLWAPWKNSGSLQMNLRP